MYIKKVSRGAAQHEQSCGAFVSFVEAFVVGISYSLSLADSFAISYRNIPRNNTVHTRTGDILFYSCFQLPSSFWLVDTPTLCI